MTRGTYTRDFYIFPTILIHNGDGIYHTVEIAWLKWYIGVCWKKAEVGEVIQWFKKNACKDCGYYCPENNVCQSKKCATCGCHPYVDWFDRHFCQPYKESEGKANG